MKGSMEATGSEGTRRGLFRRGKRSDDADDTTTSHATAQAVATVDDLARRMDELVGARAVADEPDRAKLDMQRAVIARANDLAAMSGATATGAPAVTTTSVPTPTSTTTPASEATVQQQPTPTTPAPETDADIEARLDAALKPVSVPTAAAEPTTPQATGSVTLEPTPAAPTPQPAPAAELAPTQPAPVSTASFVPGSGGANAAASIGIDVSRLVQLIEDEASNVQHRMELELRTAHARSEEIIDRAEDEAERIREHGQAQARVLLGEVEEIISEAQQTGEQILIRANEEAGTLRGDATAVLQQAQTEARAIVETARREGEQVLAEQRRLATVRAQEAMREQDRLKDQIRRLEERRRQVLESLEPLISQLTQMMPVMPKADQQQNVVQLQRQPQQHG